MKFRQRSFVIECSSETEFLKQLLLRGNMADEKEVKEVSKDLNAQVAKQVEEAEGYMRS